MERLVERPGFDRLLERYQNLVANSTEATWCIEFDEPIPLDLPELEQVDWMYRHSQIVEANEAFAANYGATLEEVIGWRMNTFLPRSLPTSVPFLLGAVRSGYRMMDAETIERAADGSERIFLNNFAGTIVAGKVLRVWGTARDVTHLRRAERETRQVREELARVGRQATLGELTATIAHELNQPLTAISANARAAQRFLAGGDADLEEIGEILGDIAADGLRAAEVIRRLRELLARRASQFEPLDLGELVRQVLPLLRGEAAIRNVAVGLELEEGLPPVRGDRVQLQQVLLNLAVNGFDAMAETPPGERRLTLQACPEGVEAIRLSVRDGGAGFQGRMPAELFAPFFTTKNDGMGMGLAIVHTIVDAHGGRLSARENPEGGATFQLTLPVAGAGQPGAVSP